MLGAANNRTNELVLISAWVDYENFLNFAILIALYILS